jgi:NAD(P) transhydrogenase
MTAPFIVIATGSRPRVPDNIPIDHEHILDSDSILSLVYLPKSLIVLGGGVIASEYASIFALLGVQVIMVDTADRPLKFLDQELTDEFCGAFEKTGGQYLGLQTIKTVQWDGFSKVRTVLESGETLESEKMLVALGRVANLENLNIQAAGLNPTTRGLISVNAHCQTTVPHIYAVGDVIGPPSLASCSMEQGRRAVCHALGLETGVAPENIPMGIYTIPEMSSVGLSEQEAKDKWGGAIIGRARFHEIARGQISGMTNGLLKMVADPKGKQLLGVHIVGEGATELIHIGQMGLLHHIHIDQFVENIFNFPTLAEAYRVAALDIVKQRHR